MNLLPAETELGPVHLTVADLERSTAYYGEAIGLRVLHREQGRAALGVDRRELIVLVEEQGAKAAPGSTGLFHLALLLPTREDLARWLQHAIKERIPLTGASDHAVSEALYLRDPDQHGIEIYADRPRRTWEGRVEALMTSMPLDANDLLSASVADEHFAGLPEGTVMGHVHLKVSNLSETETFYADLVGMERTATIPGAAVFLSAGGYHHHVAGNIWESAGNGPPPEGAAALRHATLVLPSSAERDSLLERLAAGGVETESSPDGPLVRDPSGNRLLLAA
jgi:catechol 2,3-dioxygenase